MRDHRNENLRHGRNTRRRGLVGAALAAGAVLLLPAVALAQPGPGWGRGGGQGWGRGPCGRGAGPGWHRGRAGRAGGGPAGALLRGDLERAKKALALTADQVRKIEALRRIHPPAMGRLRLEKQRLRAQMRVEWLKDSPSAATLRSLHAKVMEKEQAMAKARFEVRLQIATLLSADQRAKLRSLRGFGGFGRGFGRGAGRGFGRGGGGGF